MRNAKKRATPKVYIDPEPEAPGLPRISLRDLAREAGVSHSTVSLALRDHPAVAAATRHKIRELARQLGYRPDPMLSALAEYRRDRVHSRYRATLGWINFFGQSQTPHEPFGYRLGAATRASELGYKMDIFSPSATPGGLQQLTRILKARNIQGLLLSPLTTPGPVDFDFSQFSVITFGFSMTAPRLHIVTNNQAFSGILALQELRKRGFRRIGFLISRTLDERSRRNFHSGFLSEQMTLPAAERIPPFIHPAGLLRKHDFEALRPWFRRYRPDAIISHYAELLALLRENGLRVPEDLAVARLSVGTNPDSEYNRSAGVNQNEHEVGKAAVNMLSSMIYRNEKGVPPVPGIMLVDGFWQDGETVIPRHMMAKKLPLLPLR